MKIRFSLLGLASTITLGLIFGFAQPSWASGDYYANADSADKSDVNSCRSKAAPCATIGGAINKILESATPQNSTIHAKGTFTEGVAVNHPDLEGLTLTWLNEGTRPVIDGTGETGGIIISGVDQVSIKHMEVHGAQSYGIYAYGASDTHTQNVTIQDCIVRDLNTEASAHYGIYISYVDDALIKGNTIRSFDTVGLNENAYTANTGIYVLRSDRPQIINNTIRDISADLTFSEEDSYVYPIVSGIYVYEADEALIQNNEIKDLITRGTQSATTGYLYMYTYGIYLNNSLHSTISKNTIRRIKALATSTADEVTPYAYVYGIYMGLTDDTLISRNKILNPKSSVQVLDDESGQALFYGIFTDMIGQVNITRNTVSDASAVGVNGDVNASIYGMYINDVEQPYIAYNRLLDLASEAQGTGHTTTYAMRIADSPQTDIVNNRIENFTATVASEEAQNDSLGMYIDYNSSADILNNLIYFTTSTTQNNIDGIVVDSAQADPVRVFHNTMHNLRTCLQVDNGGTLLFENNICNLSTSGAYGVQVDTDVFDLTGFTSNNNIFYNSAEPVLMNDIEVGILNWSDWKSGIYNQDKKSIKKDPQLTVVDPTKKGYLHLTTTSPAIDAGDADIKFGNDGVMNTLLRKDWDNQTRPQGSNYDIGADEFTL